MYFKYIYVRIMSTHYLTNAQLLAELRKCHEKEKLTDNAVSMFYMLIDRIQRRLYYKSEDVKEDCRAHAMMVIAENWQKCDITRHNPFAYFTRIVMNGLAYAWNKNERRPIHISINAFINNDADEG